MELVRIDPFREMDRLHSEMNRLFEGLAASDNRRNGGGQASGQNGTASSSALAPFASGRLWSPLVDVAETPSGIVLRAEVPGMKQNEIDIELTGDTLTVKGERKFENEERKDNFVRVERSYGRFQRSFTLGVPVRHDDVTASVKDGILEIHLPKAEANRPRKVQVTNGDDAAAAAVESAPAPTADHPVQPAETSGNTAQTTDAGASS